jgi:hypothetical protein
MVSLPDQHQQKVIREFISPKSNFFSEMFTAIEMGIAGSS